jgi:hypothetical protein
MTLCVPGPEADDFKLGLPVSLCGLLLQWRVPVLSCAKDTGTGNLFSTCGWSPCRLQVGVVPSGHISATARGAPLCLQVSVLCV